MKLFSLILIAISCCSCLTAQEIVQLDTKGNPDVEYTTQERTYYSPIWDTDVVTNVSVPSMQVFRPEEDTNTGTAVIIAPGGALYAHSITSEGNDVAKWLAQKGVTAFVLKYRLVPTGKEGITEVGELFANNPTRLYEMVDKVMPYSIEDGLSAIEYVRNHAKDFGIESNKVGLMGFSAGGALTMGVAYHEGTANKPNFLVPVYPWTTVMPVQKPNPDAPPMLIVCASDDGLGLAKGSIELYNSWHNEGLNAALHMYSKGDHGFGMREKGLPSDKWIERFYEWAVAESLISPINSTTNKTPKQ